MKRLILGIPIWAMLFGVGFPKQDEDDWRKLIERLLKDRKRKDFETEHYKMNAGEITGEELKDSLEKMYRIWTEALGIKIEGEKLRVDVTADEDDYKKEVPISSLAYYRKKDGILFGLAEATLFNNLVREGTYQILHQSAPNAYDVMPAWLKRGLALYFGAVDVAKDKTLTMNSITTRENFNTGMAWKKLLRDRKVVPLKKLFESTEEEFEASARTWEIEAWAAAWFFFNKNGQAAALRKLVAAFQAGKPRAEAYSEVFAKGGKIDWSGLDSDFTNYWKNLKIEIADREEGDWHIAETEHYTIRVQKGTKNVKTKLDERQVLKDMKFKMELLFEKYALAFRFEGKLSKRPQMRLYKDRAAYIRSGAPGSSAAYYNPATKELVGYEDSAETGIVFQIFCHEGCHQFFDLAFPGFYDSEDLPMWFSEGLADCFGSSEIVGKDLHVFTVSGTATWRIETIREAIQMKRHPSIRDLLEMGRGPFMADGGLHYAQSWSFCHFLWNSPNQVGGGGKYKEVVIRLIEGFKAGHPKDEVYRDAFRLGTKPLSYDDLEAEWKTYIKSLRVKMK